MKNFLFASLAMLVLSVTSYASPSRDMFPSMDLLVGDNAPQCTRPVEESRAVPNAWTRVLVKSEMLVTSLPPCDTEYNNTLREMFEAEPTVPLPSCGTWSPTCPEGYSVDWACIAEKANDYTDAIEAADKAWQDTMAGLAADGMTEYQNAEDAFNACTDPPMECDDVFCGTISNLVGTMASKIAFANFALDVAYTAACDDYKAAVQECCTPDEQ